MKKWRGLVVFGFLFLIFFLAGCQSYEKINPSNEANTKNFDKVRVVLLPYISFAPFFIADEEGYFKEQGIEVEFVKFASLSTAVPALAQGDLDIGAGAISASLFNAIARGINIKIVADKGRLNSNCSIGAIVVRKDLFDSGEITEIAHLKGKKIALSDYSIDGYLYSEIFNRGNLSLGDIEKVELGPTERIGALKTKSIAAVALGEPSITRAVDEGLAVKLIGYEKVASDFQMGTILYGPNLLENNPELGNRFMVAYLKAVRQYNEGKTERNVEIIQKYTELDRETVERSCWYSFDDDGRLNTPSLMKMQNWSFENGYIDSLVTEDQLVDESFIDSAINALN